jgi:asparagine synthetase B (glutamine-hydrolysing)
MPGLLLASSYFPSTRSSQAEDEILQEALQCLSVIEGTFAFVIYDSVFHRVLAARDSDGTQPLYWGATGGKG